MKKNKKLTIGLQVVSLSDAYNIELIRSINAVATKFDVNLILFMGGTPGYPLFKGEHQQSVIYNQIHSKNVDAIITLTPTLKNYLNDDEFLELITKFSSVPIISLGLDISKIVKRQSSILINSQSGLSDLIENLILKQNHLRLAFLTGPMQNPEARSRLNTYKDVLTKHNIQINEDYIYYGTFMGIDAPHAIDQFTRLDNPPTVIICSNDLGAIGIIEELNRRKIKIPEQMAVTGYDNIEGSNTTNPPLSTVSQSFLKMGAKAVELAIDHINGKTCSEIYEIETDFVQRQSCSVNSKHSYNISQKNSVVSELQKDNVNLNNLVLEIEESSILTLLNKLIFNIYNNIENKKLCFIEFEENYKKHIIQKIKLDLRVDNGFKTWSDSIKKIEDIEFNSNEKNNFINLLTIRIREILLKEESIRHDTEVESRDNIYFVKDLVEEISDAYTFDELTKKVFDKYGQLSNFINLKNYLILAYPNSIKKFKDQPWDEPDKIDVVLSFHKNINNKPLKELDSSILFPDYLAPEKDRYTIVTETIYSSDNQLGRVIYELYPNEIELFSCAMVTTQISSTIKNIHQRKERKIAQDKIDLLVKDLETKKALAEEAVVAKGHFLATMSHEIRTPMNGVLGVAQLLKDTPLNAQQVEYIDIINSSSHSLLNIISDILDFSKIEEGKLSIEHIDFNLRKLCNEVMSVFSFNTKNDSILLSLEISEKIPEIINSDPTRLRQVLINLIGNAFKFTDKGSITLKIDLEENQFQQSQQQSSKIDKLIKFSIIDTGIGISKENIEKLFGAFNQADSSITRKFGGTGLGLSISKSLSELMGGDIGVNSIVNDGSTFWFTILSHTNKQALKPLKPKKLNTFITSDIKQFTNKEILIAEDNKVNQMVIKGVIKKFGPNVTIVENGQEAVDEFQKHSNKYDLIIMDFEMPILDGASATKKIRAIEISQSSKNRIPIIAITAHAMAEHKERCIQAGMDDHLSKPIDSEKLYEILQSYFEIS